MLNRIGGINAPVAVASCLALLTVSGCDSERVCTRAGCGPDVTWEVALPAPLTQAQAQTISFCVNELCMEGMVDALSEPTANAGRVLTLPSTPDQTGPRLELVAGPGAGGSALSVSFFAANYPLRDGDRVRGRLLTAANTVVAEIDEVVTYRLSYPNGPDCGPGCKQVSIGEGTGTGTPGLTAP